MELKDYITLGIALIGVLIGILNWIMGYENANRFISNSDSARRVDRSNELLKEFYSPEFMQIQSDAKQILKDADSNSEVLKEIALFLAGNSVFDKYSSLAMQLSTKQANGLSLFQHLSLFMNFWHRLSLFAKANQIDLDILSPIRDDLVELLPYLMKLKTKYEDLERNESVNHIPPWFVRRENHKVLWDFAQKRSSL